MLDAAARSLGYRLHHHASLGSTNEEALSLGRAGDPGRLWILADSQSAGRGRVGRSWSSPVGNHHATLLLADPATAATPRSSASSPAWRSPGR